MTSIGTWLPSAFESPAISPGLGGDIGQWGKPSPRPLFRPCLYIDIYPFFFLSLPEKPPQDAAEDNPLFPASFFLFLLVFSPILLLLFLLYYYYYYWLYAVSSFLSPHHCPCPPLANLKSPGWKVKPWEPQWKVSNFDLPFSLGNSVLIPPFSPMFFPWISVQSRAEEATLLSRRDLKCCLAAMNLQVLLNGANFVLWALPCPFISPILLLLVLIPHQG